MLKQRDIRIELEEARNTGALAAARELRRLRVDMTEQVNIFRIIEDAELWLLFQPMGNLLGAYLPGGVLINTQRPHSVQRLTAGHEYGHYVLKHEASLDDESNLDGSQVGRFRPGSRSGLRDLLSRRELLEEAAAQAFATDFLMPPQLVNRFWIDLGLPGGAEKLQAAQVYRLSLFLGTSYTATLHQLVALSKIKLEVAQELLGVRPQQIKQTLVSEVDPRDWKSDVWPIRESDAGRAVVARVGDELHIQLPEKPSTGYIWSLSQGDVAPQHEPQQQFVTEDSEVDDLDEAQPIHDFELVTTRFEKPSSSDAKTIGGGGMRRFVLRVLRPGYHSLKIVNHRPWQPENPAKEFRLDVRSDLPTGDGKPGFSARQKSLLVSCA